MTRRGKPGKPNPGFPPFPQRLEIACAIPTSPRSGRDGFPLAQTARSLALVERSEATLISCGNLAWNSAFRVNRNRCPARSINGRFWGDHEWPVLG
jgi:hypothetical protein